MIDKTDDSDSNDKTNVKSSNKDDEKLRLVIGRGVRLGEGKDQVVMLWIISIP